MGNELWHQDWSLRWYDTTNFTYNKGQKCITLFSPGSHLCDSVHIILFHAILWVNFLFISHIFHLYSKPWLPYLKNDIITKATYSLSVRASCCVFFYSTSCPWRRQGSFSDLCFSLCFPGPYILLLSFSILFQFSISITQKTTWPSTYCLSPAFSKNRKFLYNSIVYFHFFSNPLI